MATRKVTGGTTSKGKAKATAKGTTSKRVNTQPPVEGSASATSQEPSVGTQPSLSTAIRPSISDASGGEGADEGTIEVGQRAKANSSQP